MVALTPELAYLKASQQYFAGQLERAQEICRKLVDADPGHMHAAYLLAVVEHRLGNHAQGDRLLQQAVAQRDLSIRLTYSPPQTPRHAKTPNTAIDALLAPHIADFGTHLRSFARWLPWLRNIPATPASDDAPYWNNMWIPPLDGIAIYCTIAAKRPRRYIEVGSGNSTLFAHRAIADHQLETQIISIDPHPRAEIDTLCDEVVRSPLEAADLTLFATLGADDVVFIDNSHHCFMNSDVTVFFTEVLPGLARGVTVGIHDIFLPYDYPAAWVEKYFSEQYLLACYLLSGAPRFKMLLPAFYATKQAQLQEPLATLAAGLDGVALEGAAFWFEMA